jgi:hypothetical protein
VSDEREKELLEEIDRLKVLVQALEKKRKRKSASVEFGLRNPEGMLHFVVTCPGSLDETSFGNFVVAQTCLLLNSAGAVAAKMQPGARVIP